MMYLLKPWAPALFFAITLVASMPVGAQQIVFEKAFAFGLRAEPFSVIPTSTDGGYLVAGAVYRDTSTSWDFLLVKTDANGDTLWTKIWAEPDGQGLRCVRATSGGYVVCGFTYYQTAGADDAVVMRLDSLGNEIWRIQTGGAGFDYAHSMVALADGALVWVGGEGTYLTLNKIGADGTPVWKKKFGNTIWGVSNALIQTHDGGFALAGAIQLSADDIQMYIVRTDSTGQLKWEKRYGYFGFDEALSIQEAPDGHLWVGGYHEHAVTNQAALLKLDPDGLRLADVDVGYAWDDYFADVEILDNDRYVFIGGAQTPDADTNLVYNSDGYFLGANADCDTLWSLRVNSQDFQFYFDACKSPDGGIVACGTSRVYWTPSIWSDTIRVYLIKINGIPTGVNTPGAVPKPMAAWPNPASDQVNLLLPGLPDSGDQLCIFDAVGRLVRAFRVTPYSTRQTMSISDLTNGFYQCIFYQKDKAVAQTRFIVQH